MSTEEKYNYQFLDKIDFLPYIEKFKGKKFIDMMMNYIVDILMIKL